jgi:hypothetical protein
MVDTFETARHFGLIEAAERMTMTGARAPFEHVLSSWMELTVALNQLNRSMGLPDPYPFDIGERPGEKLAFVHDVVASTAQHGARPPPPLPGSGDGLDVDRDAQAV